MKWKFIAIATVLVAAWMFRWENIYRAGLHLDRWTGNIVTCDRESSRDPIRCGVLVNLTFYGEKLER